MERENIIVGRYYLHPDHPHSVYMGVSVLRKNGKEEKNMVIIEGGLRGRLIAENASDIFWQKFYEK